MSRAYNQAQKFGVRWPSPTRSTSFEPGATGAPIRARRWPAARSCRRARSCWPAAPAIAGSTCPAWRIRVRLGALLGLGDGADPVRRRGGGAGRRRQFGRPGGGLSGGAGQEGLAAGARPGLEATMSRYLIDRIAALPNVELLPHTEIVGLEGEAARSKVRWRDRRGDRRRRRPIAQPVPVHRRRPGHGLAVEFRPGDGRQGFVTDRRRGDRAVAARNQPSPACSRSATSASGSVKRVAAAVGEGAQVVAAIHAFLSHSQGPHL